MVCDRETARTNTESEHWDNRESWCTEEVQSAHIFKFICLINHSSLHEPTLSASFLIKNLVTLVPKPGKEAGSPLPSCPHRRDRHLRMSSSRSWDSTRNTIKRCWTWGRTRKDVSVPSSRTSRRTASCSGAGWTGRFGPGGFQRLRPRPPTCRYRRWGRRTTRRRSSTCSRGPQRHVGGPRRTGQCASSPC